MSDLIFSCRDVLKYHVINRFCLIGLMLLILPSELVRGQKKLAESVKEASEYLEERGEVFLRIPVSEKAQILSLSNTISIDRIDGNFVYVYASQKGFDSLVSKNLAFSVEIPPSLRIKVIQEAGEFPGEWNGYPSYDEYIAFIQKLAGSFPEICHLDTIGFSVNKRVIMALKISDQVLKDEPEPCFLYTSTIHGDEPGGFFLLLRLADWLLNGYGNDLRITGLINNLQIWINPLSNPDGTYFMGNASVFGAKRFNINNIDLNRNFPDPEEGPHPDGQEYQPENLAMMKFMESRHFSLSANLHGGAELVNYPWDTWEKFHPDDDWYRFISRQYADTVHKFRNLYMTDMVNGITNGYAWYSIAGGRQDYVNYFLNGREVTLELSRDKIPLADTLSWLWEYNHRSLFNYMEQTLFGITGIVTDRVTSKPIRSRIEIPGHDSLNSYVWSDSISGRFSRMIKEGIYDLKISASGHKDTLITSVSVTDYSTAFLNISLSPVYSGVDVNKGTDIHLTNPFTGDLKISVTAPVQENILIDLFDISGRKVVQPLTVNCVDGENVIVIDGASLGPGIYILRICSPAIFYQSIVIKSG